MLEVSDMQRSAKYEVYQHNNTYLMFKFDKYFWTDMVVTSSCHQVTKSLSHIPLVILSYVMQGLKKSR